MCGTCISEKEYFRRLFEKFPENVEKFNYKNAHYVNNKSILDITCNNCGEEFHQTAFNHMQGNGCNLCYRFIIKNDEYFRKLFERFPENLEKFDYKDAHYTGALNTITLTCKAHGHKFDQAAHAHYQGAGCNICAKMPISKELYLERLFIKFPENETEYDYEKVIYKGNKIDILIKHNICGNEFCQQAGKHAIGHGCRDCYGTPKKTTDKFIKEADAIHEGKYKYHLVKYEGREKEVTIVCPEHGEFLQTPASHLRGCGCLECSGLRLKTTDEFNKEADEIHEGKYKYHLVDYKNSKTPVIIWCPVHGAFEQLPSNHLKGHGCDACGGTKTKTTDEFKAEAIAIHGNKFNYDSVIYVNGSTEVEIYCNTCNKFFSQLPEVHLMGCGCSKCSGHGKTTEDFIDEANEVHDFKYGYVDTIYEKCDKKVKIICPKHGTFEQRPSSHLAGKGCQDCNTSKGEVEIRKILKKFQIDYDTQYKFEDCRGLKNKLPFDFVIFENRTMLGLIEFQGEQHYIIPYYSSDPTQNEKAFSDIQRSDNLKNEYCKNNDINLFEITYKDLAKGSKHIEQMISKFFPKLFPKQLDMFYKNPYKIECKDLSDVEVEEPEDIEEDFEENTPGNPDQTFLKAFLKEFQKNLDNLPENQTQNAAQKSSTINN